MEANEIFTMAKKMSNQLRQKFYSIPFEDILSQSCIAILENMNRRPDMSDSLLYVTSRWDVFHYCCKRVDYVLFELSYENTDRIAIDKIDIRNSTEYYNKTKNDLEREIDKTFLPEDALIVLNGILHNNLYTNDGTIPKSKTRKGRIEIKMHKDKKWPYKRTAIAIDEISKWWKSYA